MEKIVLDNIMRAVLVCDDEQIISTVKCLEFNDVLEVARELSKKEDSKYTNLGDKLYNELITNIVDMSFNSDADTLLSIISSMDLKAKLLVLKEASLRLLESNHNKLAMFTNGLYEMMIKEINKRCNDKKIISSKKKKKELELIRSSVYEYNPKI